MRDLEK